MTTITFTQVNADLARLNQYNLALEGFRCLMEGRDVVTGPTAVAMRIALEDRDRDDDDKSDRGVTGRDIASGFKKVVITVRNIIQWLLRKIGSLVEKLGLGMQKLGNKTSKAQRRAAKKAEAERAEMGKGENAELPKEAIQPDQLSIAGAFVGNDVEAVNNVIKLGTWINNDFPKMFDSLMNGVEHLATTHMKDESSAEFFKGLGELIKNNPPRIGIPYSGQSFASDGAGDKETNNTVPLMGDKGLLVLDPQGNRVLEEDDPVAKLRGWFHFSLADYNTKKPNEGPVPVADFATVEKLISMVNKSVEANSGVAGEVRSTIHGRVKKINALLDTLSEGQDTGVPGQIATAVGVILQRLAECLVSVHSYYARTLNQEVDYLQACLGGSKDEE